MHALLWMDINIFRITVPHIVSLWGWLPCIHHVLGPLEKDPRVIGLRSPAKIVSNLVNSCVVAAEGGGAATKRISSQAQVLCGASHGRPVGVRTCGSCGSGGAPCHRCQTDIPRCSTPWRAYAKRECPRQYLCDAPGLRTWMPCNSRCIVPGCGAKMLHTSPADLP
jgi:hypothetical protein